MTDDNNTFTFDFGGLKLRAAMLDGQPWFMAADACRACGLQSHQGSYAEHLRRLDPACTTPVRGSGVRFPGNGMHSAKLVSEAGLYTLVLRSDKPEARQFQDFVTGTVLPAIRKDGAYVMGEEKVVTGELTEDELIDRAFHALRAKAERLGKERDAALAAAAVAAQETAKVTAERTILDRTKVGMAPGAASPTTSGVSLQPSAA